MNFSLSLTTTAPKAPFVMGVLQSKSLSLPKELKDIFEVAEDKKSFSAKEGETYSMHSLEGKRVLLWGLGEKSKISREKTRKTMAKLTKGLQSKYSEVAIDASSFLGGKSGDENFKALCEGILLSAYQFDKFLSDDKGHKLKKVHLVIPVKNRSKWQRLLKETTNVCESVNLTRNFVNEPPNVLNSEEFAKRVVKDVRTNLKGANVRTKVLGKKELQKEKMGLFLSVNAGSAYQPQLVHLTYTPKNVKKNTKHIGLVGKGLTFDTGGYSLKPSVSMVNMKFDMAGAATLYGAFRSAVLNKASCKITCVLGMTDNAVNSLATMPDSICTSRKGTTVEILNTDAEGRLVLADCLDYICDQKVDQIIDAATLTGAMLIALGSEVCGVFSNDQKMADSMLKAADKKDEYLWQLPVVDEYRQDMKSPIADLKNIGGSRNAGSAKAAAFLEHFVADDVSWCHLDIAGVGDSQSHLPYCPTKGGSGIMVRSITEYLMSQ